MSAHGPLCVGIDPHPGLLSAGGCPRRRTGWSVRRRPASRPSPDGGGGQAAVGVLRAVRSRGVAVLERPWPGCARRARCPCWTSSAATSARPCRLRRGLPRQDAVAAGRRDHGQPVPRLRARCARRSTSPRTPARASSCSASRPTPKAPRSSTPGARRQRRGAVVAGARRQRGASPLGSLGLVVGATVGPRSGLGLDLAALNGPLLAPGIGAQGAGAEDLRAVFGDALPSVLARSAARCWAGPTPRRCAGRRTRRRRPDGRGHRRALTGNGARLLIPGASTTGVRRPSAARRRVEALLQAGPGPPASPRPAARTSRCRARCRRPGAGSAATCLRTCAPSRAIAC